MVTILLKEGRRHIWKQNIQGYIPDNYVLLETILKKGCNYRVFYDSNMEAVITPPVEGMSLVIFRNRVSYYRVGEFDT